MATQLARPTWRIVAQTVTGAAHDRAALPNQDAHGWFPEAGAGPPAILAVADGHGSAKSFRSDIGSQEAVAAALERLGALLQGQAPEVNSLSSVKRVAEEHLPQSLVQAWRERVEAHLARHPIAEADWDRLVQKDGPAARSLVAQEPLLAYGATILAVLVTEDFILYLQLGDGDILVVAEDGATTRPFARDERLIANETTSLCSRDAWREVRVRLVPLAHNPPAMILISTDGYANSFRSEEDFLRLGPDYLHLVRAEGLERVAQDLRGFLDDASRKGSGDDITLGIIARAESRGDVALAGPPAPDERRAAAGEQGLRMLQARQERVEERLAALQRQVIVAVGALAIVVLGALAVILVVIMQPPPEEEPRGASPTPSFERAGPPPASSPPETPATGDRE